jgi:transcription-repair coupling factor (superfamily II helicase)
VSDLQKILSADKPMTLAGAPAGFLPWLAADLARAAQRKNGGARAVFIAPDEVEMRAVADAAHYFAPELEVLTFPAWDCLPYDRSSPSLRSTSERLATLHALQRKAEKPQLLLTTINAALQRTLTPFRIRQLVARLAPGERIDLNRLTALLHANGYSRSDTVADAGEYAVRGGLVDLFPSGEEDALRLDFFGDEIENVRRFDPGTQRTTGRAESFTLLPASETLLDEDSIKRFRSRYRELFGAASTGDPLYQAVSDGRRIAGLDHWLPLFEEKLATLFDHLSGDDIIVRENGTAGAADARFEAIEDYYQNRVRAQTNQPGSYRPLEAKALYLLREEWEKSIKERPLHLVTPFREPESAKVLDFAEGAHRTGPARRPPRPPAQAQEGFGCLPRRAVDAQPRRPGRSSRSRHRQVSDGLEPITVGKSQHDCVMLEYAGGDKLYIPVENIDVLSRYGSSEEGATLDRLGGEGWQRRKARLKERIREIAHALLRTAAARALRKARCSSPTRTPSTSSSSASPMRRPTTRTARSMTSWRPGRRQADGPAGLRRCRLRQDRGRAARRLRRRDGGPSRSRWSCPPRCSPASTTRPSRSVSPASREYRPLSRLVPKPELRR